MSQYISDYSTDFSSDFDIGRMSVILQIIDPILDVMLLLKNGWGLTDSGISPSDITFTTGWFNQNIIMPQISVTQIRKNQTIMECGSAPLYYYNPILAVNIWVRPSSDSNKSIGSAKHTEYVIRKEVERIIRSGSHIGNVDNKEEFIYIGRWRRLDEMDTRSIILRSMIEISDNYFREFNEES